MVAVEEDLLVTLEEVEDVSSQVEVLVEGVETVRTVGEVVLPLKKVVEVVETDLEEDQ